MDGVLRPLAPTDLALRVKNSFQPGTYCFVYGQAGQPNNKPSRTCPSDPPPSPPAESFLPADAAVEPEAAEDSLITL